MDTGNAALIIAFASLAFTILVKFFDGSRNNTATITMMDVTMKMMQEDVREMTKAVKEIADVKSDIRDMNTRMLRAEEDIRNMRRGEGFIVRPNDNREHSNG